MKLIVIILLLSTNVFSQPGGYTPGTFVNWNFNGRDHGFFAPAGWTAGATGYHPTVFFHGSGETTFGAVYATSPPKFLQDDAVDEWGGTIPLPGPALLTGKIIMLTILSGTGGQAHEDDIAFFLQNIGTIDTSKHENFTLSGLSLGVQRCVMFTTGRTALPVSPYANVFKNMLLVSSVSVSEDLTDLGTWSAGRRLWIWVGADDVTTPPSISTAIYNAFNGEKTITIQAGTGHDGSTWDEFYKVTSTTIATSRWIWAVNAPPGSRLKQRFRFRN